MPSRGVCGDRPSCSLGSEVQAFLVGSPALSLGLELLSVQVPCTPSTPAVSTPPGAPRLQCWAVGLLEGAGNFSPGGSTPCCTDGGCVVTESQDTERQEGSQDSGFDWWHLKFLIPALEKICQKQMKGCLAQEGVAPIPSLGGLAVAFPG